MYKSQQFNDFNRVRDNQISPYFCHHSYVRSAETRRNRLVCAFSAEAEIELLAEDRFPWPREHVIERGKVHVGAAHNRNKGWLGHHFRPGARSTLPAAAHRFTTHAKGSFLKKRRVSL